jgi:DNA replication ATP-dependent helicase Dna2
MLLVGAVLDASRRRRPLRVLLCTSTYKALDNVFLRLRADLEEILPGSIPPMHRLRSYAQALEPEVPTELDLEVNQRNPSPDLLALRSFLEQRTGIVLVGSTPEQAYNLLTTQGSGAVQPFFDLIVIDEASQMDVSHAILAFCGAAPRCSVVLAGDPLQLPPIHKAEAPLGLEGMVGSVYSFFRDVHGIAEEMLEDNYRSNATIVDFTREAGYRTALSSYSPNLRLSLLDPLPTERPANWPAELFWSSEWGALLEPDQPATCVVYRDGRSSQSNPFEADAVASLLWLLYGRLAGRLFGERSPTTGNFIQSLDVPYTPSDFWRHAVGVVTPHRAQQGLVVSRLQSLFGHLLPDPTLIRGAVDTVERFQGQERDVMIASYALGDPDQIEEEDEFLMSLKRFNVMASRARAKLIVLLSREVTDHLSSDLDTLRESRLLKVYAERFCDASRPIELGVGVGAGQRLVPAVLRWRS